jgi:glycosyltransferase involved in cell wall biosynthesis
MTSLELRKENAVASAARSAVAAGIGHAQSVPGDDQPHVTQNSPMRIAMVDPSLFTRPYDCELVRALAEQGATVTFFGRPLRREEGLPDSIRMVKRFYQLGEKLPKWARKPVKGVEHIFDMSLFAAGMVAQPPSIIHFQWCPLPALDAIAVSLLRRVAPVLLTVHDPNPYNGTNLGVMNSGALKLPNRVDAVIVHSEAGRAQLVRNGVAERNIHVIPHGPLPVRGADIAPAPHEKFAIVAFGKIKPYKGLDTLVAALAALSPDLKEKVELIVVGEPAMDLAEIRALAERSGVSVRWHLRFVADAEIDFWLSQSDLFVFPYRDIDASGVMMSCLKYGKPVIASRIGTFAEILKDGVHGYLIDPGRPAAAFADAITRIVASPDLAEAMGGEVGRLTDRLPSWIDIARATMALYRDTRQRWLAR